MDKCEADCVKVLAKSFIAQGWHLRTPAFVAEYLAPRKKERRPRPIGRQAMAAILKGRRRK